MFAIVSLFTVHGKCVAACNPRDATESESIK